MKIGILGAGAWGTALALTAEKAGNSVILWSHAGLAYDFFGAEKLEITKNLADLAETEVWLVATPAAYFRETMLKSRPFWKNQPIIICTKGLEPDTGKFMSEVLQDAIPELDGKDNENKMPPAASPVGVLSGPQFAAEVAKGVPTGSTLAGSEIVQKAGKIAFGDGLFLVPSEDIIGAEVCGVGKNAVAIIAGFYSIKAAGENEKALKFTQAWGEVCQLGLRLGAKLETFLGLCGIGDLFLSATSATSRNFSAGVALAKGEMPQGTVEGLSALTGLCARAESVGVKMPVLEEMLSRL